MTQIVETAEVGEPAAEVWARIGRFGGLADWHPMVTAATCDGEAIGAVRRVLGIDGQVSVDRLTDRSSRPFFYRYRVEETQMPVSDYVGELRVEQNEDGASTVVWSADFELTLSDFRTIENVRAFLKTGLTAVKDECRRAPM